MRAVVGLSGGVDSSVAAALAVEAGFEAVGVIVHHLEGASRCCSLEDARRVCDRLGMRFYAADRVARFRCDVMGPFADAYLEGRTPNPCVTCNRSFKFDVLRARARAFDAERIVTGHYARVEQDPETGRHRLLRGRDPEKDQSYFLFQLDQATLAELWFPLGDLTKAQVRAFARERDLPTADKPESQEICFVADDDYAAAVERIRPGAARAGEVVDESGRVLGRHEGIHRFTIGQRRGLGVSSGGKLYVTGLDSETGRVRVGPAGSLEARGAEVERVTWIDGRAPERPRAEVAVRYGHSGAAADIEPAGEERVRVHFDEPVAAVAPGQAAVFYDGDRVLGGGFITTALL